MKYAILPLLMLFSLLGCQKEVLDINDNSALSTERGQKVKICHHDRILMANINSLSGHRKHGDAVDLDGDGYFDIASSCSVLVDCDDSDAAASPSAWNGNGTDTNGIEYAMNLYLDCDYSSGLIDYGFCSGALTLASQSGDVYTYSQDITSGCLTDCIVTVEILADGSVNYLEDCGDAQLPAILMPF